VICRSGDRSLSQIPLWSPERPALHDVVLSSETDQIAGCIGFRTIKTRGTDILLNANFVRMSFAPSIRATTRRRRPSTDSCGHWASD